MRRISGMALTWLLALGACNDVDDFEERALGPDDVVVAGGADFTRYVAIGDSYAAGVVNGAFTCSGQLHAYPTLIARQAGLQVADSCSPPELLSADFSAFQQPLVTDPGVGSPLVLTSPGPPPVIAPVPATGVPTNGALARPYNNLAVPGAEVREINVARNQQTSLDANSAFNPVLRGIGTAPEQAALLDATFVTFWLGGNDALEAVLSGGTTPVTPAATFDAEFERALDSLLRVTPDVVLGNIGDLTLLPFATTIPPVAIDPATQQPVLIGGQPVPLIGPAGTLDPALDFVLLSAASLLRQGMGVPAALGGTGQPLPDQVVLDGAEVAEIREAVAAYNRTISGAAAEHDLALVDIDAEAEAIVAAGGAVEARGQALSIRFLGGGTAAPFFGLDGFHPTPKGYGHFANLFIEAINARYGSRHEGSAGAGPALIPLIDVSTLPTLIGSALAPVSAAPSAPLAQRTAAADLNGPFTSIRWPEILDTTGW